MKPGSKVQFSWDRNRHIAQGEVLSEHTDGRLFVAIDPVPPEGRHVVILCQPSWLTELPGAPATPAGAPPPPAAAATAPAPKAKKKKKKA